MAAYALVLRERDDVAEVLLAQLAPRIATDTWTLPGGEVEFGEHPDDAVVREVHEETGLRLHRGDLLLADSAVRDAGEAELHSLRIVYSGTVAPDAPAPRVVEVDGSTAAAAWHPVADVLAQQVSSTPVVRLALERHRPVRRQRLSAYGLARRGSEVLLTRISARGHRPGVWTLPGGGVDHGEAPGDALVRELFEETGLTPRVGALLGVHDVHFVGRAPEGRIEDFHGVHLVYGAQVTGEPVVTELAGTTDAAAWVAVAEVESGAVPVLEVVLAALRM